MTNSKPLLTILITTYNRAPLLHALLGLLDGYRKRGLHFDIIVSNDHSTDDTQALCGQWQERMPNLRYVETQVHEGMDPNFIRAYSACTTDYCWLLGDARFVSYEGLTPSYKRSNSGATTPLYSIATRHSHYPTPPIPTSIASWPTLVGKSPTTPRASFPRPTLDRKSTRLNSSHANISYAVFCLKKTSS